MARTVRQQQQGARGRHAVGEDRQEGVGGLVDPVQVLDHDDERPPPTRLQHERADRLERPRLDHFRARAGELTGHAEELDEVRRAPGRVHVRRRDRGADLPATVCPSSPSVIPQIWRTIATTGRYGVVDA